MNDGVRDRTARGQRFPATRWSLVLDARAGEGAARKRALSELCTMYWYPLYAYVRHRGYSPPDAEDLTQGFFSQLLASERMSRLPQVRGKLRSYMLGAVKNFIANEWHKAHAEKRGGTNPPISIEREVGESRYRHEPRDEETPELLFERNWAHSLLDRTFDRLREEYAHVGRSELFEALSGSLTGERAGAKHAAIAADLEMNEGAVRVALHRMRKRYRALLEEEIAETVESSEEIEEEIDYLYTVFA